MTTTRLTIKTLKFGLLGILSLGMVARAEVKVDEVLNFNDSRLTFKGWGEAESTHRWAVGKTSSISFKMSEHKNSIRGEIALGLSSQGKQKVDVSLNGKKIFSSFLTESQSSLTMKFDPKLLKMDGSENTLVSSLPNAKAPGNGDIRLLSICLNTFTVK